MVRDSEHIGAQPAIQAKVLDGILNSVDLPPGRKAEILRLEGLQAADLYGVAASLPFAAYLRIFDAIAQETGNETLGLDLGAAMGPAMTGAIGYIFALSPDLETAIGSLTRSVFTIQDATVFSFHAGSSPSASYRISDDSLRPQRQDVEFSLSYVHGLIRRLLGPAYAPAEVWFEHDRPARNGRHDAVFACPVFFGQDSNTIFFRQNDLRRPAANFDPGLISLLQHYIQLLDRRDHAASSFAETVSRALVPLTEDGNPSIGKVAARLGVSEATLRRRLLQEGTSFRPLLRLKRTELARRLLAETRSSILDVAHKVGYAELASFSRAFRQETGTSPSDYRRAARQS